MKRIALVLLSLALTLGLPAVEAQVSARQGTPEEVPSPTEFASPMVLESPLPRVLLGNRVSWTGLSKYTCDGVAIALIEFGYKAQSGKAGDLNATIHIQNRSEDDKRTGLKVEFLDGDRVLATRVLRDLDTESGKTLIRTVQMPASLALLSKDPAARLRFTVSVVPD